MKKGTISIVIPTFNGEKFIDKTILSVLNQTYIYFQLIFIDDCSTDATCEIIKRYSQKDNRIELYKNSHNLGNPSVSIRNWSHKFIGEYFFYMSQDDLLSDNCMEELIKACKTYDAEMSIPNLFFYYEKDSSNITSIDVHKEVGKKLISGEDAFMLTIRGKLHGFALQKMSMIDKVPYDDEFYDSTDIAVLKRYFYSHNVAIAHCANFYYRQDNLNSITKSDGIVNILTSSLYLLDFAKSNNMPHKNKKSIADRYLMLHKAFQRSYSDSKKDFLSNSFRAFKKKLIQNKMLLYLLKLLFISFFGTVK